MRRAVDNRWSRWEDPANTMTAARRGDRSAFAPDRGESVDTLIADPPPGAPVPPILPPQDGFLFLDKEKFAASFAADVDPDVAAFMADSQVPWGVDALRGRSTKRHGGRSRRGISLRRRIG